MLNDTPILPHETISHADRFALLVALYGPDAGPAVRAATPTIWALLSDYLHRPSVRLVFDEPTQEWRANTSRFLCTDDLFGYGPSSAQLPVVCITRAELDALPHGKGHDAMLLLGTPPWTPYPAVSAT